MSARERERRSFSLSLSCFSPDQQNRRERRRSNACKSSFLLFSENRASKTEWTCFFPKFVAFFVSLSLSRSFLLNTLTIRRQTQEREKCSAAAVGHSFFLPVPEATLPVVPFTTKKQSVARPLALLYAFVRISVLSHWLLPQHTAPTVNGSSSLCMSDSPLTLCVEGWVRAHEYRNTYGRSLTVERRREERTRREQSVHIGLRWECS